MFILSWMDRNLTVKAFVPLSFWCLQVEDGSVFQPVHCALHPGVAEDHGVCQWLLTGRGITQETLQTIWRLQSKNELLGLRIYSCCGSWAK